jgi:two-component system phosphate regulon sensor histidine kinase PhoR
VLNYETGGGQDRFWRVWTKPLPPNALHPRLALVIMRDETDMRLNERMRADFLANASHELRTPLASLTGFIETLRGHARDDVAARDRFLLIMSRQAERMARLIDDLMSLSRIELNEHIRPSGACDLTLAVTDVLDALAPQIAAKGVRMELNLAAAGLAEVVGDRDQIVQVVQNLLDNAVKYAPVGGVVGVSVTRGLTLEAATATRPGDVRQTAPSGGRMPLLTPVRQGAERYALLRVDDAGPGMAREHLPRLTERFYRVEGQKSGERMGTGLGLAIVKHIVNRHRGGFFVESAPSQGAGFGVYLPMTARAAQKVETLDPSSTVAGASNEPRAA